MTKDKTNIKRYKIKLIGFYAFGSEDTILEAISEREALKLAKELYPNAEDWVIIDIFTPN